MIKLDDKLHTLAVWPIHSRNRDTNVWTKIAKKLKLSDRRRLVKNMRERLEILDG